MRRALVLIAAAALAGCAAVRDAQTPEPWVRAAAVKPATDTENLLAYYEWVKRLTPPELAREGEAARAAIGRQRSDFNRIRLAMLLSLPEGGASDIPRAIELLEPVARNREAPLHTLALLLHTHLGEQRRGSAELGAMRHRLDTAQHRLEAAQQRLESTQQRLDATQQKLEATQQKLDALKALERSLGGRRSAPR